MAGNWGSSARCRASRPRRSPGSRTTSPSIASATFINSSTTSEYEKREVLWVKYITKILFYWNTPCRRRSELIVRSFNSSSDAGKYECRAKNKASKAIVKRRIMIKASAGESSGLFLPEIRGCCNHLISMPMLRCGRIRNAPIHF